MNEQQKNRKSLRAFAVASPENLTIARRVYFAKTNLGTKGMKVDELVTKMVQAGLTIRDITKAMA